MSQHFHGTPQHHQSPTTTSPLTSSPLTSSKRRKIFAGQPWPNEKIGHSSSPNQSPNNNNNGDNMKDRQTENDTEAESQLFRLIDKLNARLQASKHLWLQNLALRQQNGKLKEAVRDKASQAIDKSNEDMQELKSANRQLRERMERGRQVAELLQESKHKSQLVELLDA